MKREIHTALTVFKGLTGKHSKYGGSYQYNAISQQYGEATNWYCQVCGQEQPPLLSPHVVEVNRVGFVKVCPMCYVKELFKQIRRLE